MPRDYIIVSKQVGAGLSALLGDKAEFSEAEIEDLGRQPWVRRIGRFTSSDFNVAASVDAGGHSMSTYLFFESIPDDYFDTLPAGWSFDPARPFIPVILPKDYLALYNFGFAGSRGMPQVSEEMVGLIPVRISLSGRGRQQWLSGRVVGFSSRLNTIAVPQAFMDWGNAEFGEHGGATAPSRLIVEVDNPGDPVAERYLADHGIEVAGDKLAGGRSAYFFTVVTGVVVAVGAVDKRAGSVHPAAEHIPVDAKKSRKTARPYDAWIFSRAYSPVLLCVDIGCKPVCPCRCARRSPVVAPLMARAAGGDGHDAGLDSAFVCCRGGCDGRGHCRELRSGAAQPVAHVVQSMIEKPV